MMVSASQAAPEASRQQPSAHHSRGFTLFETIIVIAMLALASAGIMSMHPQVFKTQTNGRDQVVGLDLLRACGEKLLAVRRSSGYAAVSATLCDGLGGIGGFNSNPAVVLKDAANTVVSACGTGSNSSTCTATISLAKSSAPAASLSSLTIQFSSY